MDKMDKNDIKIRVVMLTILGALFLAYAWYVFFIRHETVTVKFARSGPYFIMATWLLSMAWTGWLHTKK